MKSSTSAEYFPFRIVGWDSKPCVQVETGGGMKVFAPEEISAMLLRKLKQSAEAHLNETVTHAVITVPAYFTRAQLQAMEDAAAIAGLAVMRFVNEATAVGIAYGRHNIEKGEHNALVLNLGGGSLDVSVMTIDRGIFELVATRGSNKFGCLDFDHRLMEHYTRLYLKSKDGGVDLRKDKRALGKLRREIERSVRHLSTANHTQLEIESLTGGQDFSETLTRETFEDLNRDLFHSAMKVIKETLQDAEMRAEDVDVILTSGGGSRVPKLRQMVQDFFGDKAPVGFGSGVGFFGVGPDEAAVFGATMLAGFYSGEQDARDMILLDVIPFSIGIEIEGGRMKVLLPRNTMLPIKRSHTFQTTQEDQSSVTVRVFEGESPLAANNLFLDQLQLQLTEIVGGGFDWLSGAGEERRRQEIEVTIEIDAVSRITVTAQQKATGNKESVSISMGGKANGLSSDRIDRMMRENELLEEEDARFKERQDGRDALEALLYRLQNRELSEGEKRMIREGFASLEENEVANAEYSEYEKKRRDLLRIMPEYTDDNRRDEL